MAYIDTKTFIEIYPTSTDFVNSFRKSSFSSYITDDIYLEMTYELLLSKYENSHIACLTSDSFIKKVNSTIFMYGPSWVRKLSIQDRLRELSEQEITTGAVSKFTHGYNPSDVPGTANSDTEIETVNEQSLNKYTKGKLDGYANLLELLKEDVTNTYINKFRKLFMLVIDLDDVLTIYQDGGHY